MTLTRTLTAMTLIMTLLAPLAWADPSTSATTGTPAPAATPGASAAPAEAGTSRFDQALALFYDRHWVEAQDEFNKVLQEDATNAMAMFFLLDCAVKQDKLAAAINQFEDQSVAKPNDPLAQAQVGIAYYARGLTEVNFLDEALNQFKSALKIDPNLSLANTGMGLVYYQKRMKARCQAYFQRALQTNPNDLLALELLGESIQNDDKRPEEALVYFQQMAQVDPNYPDTYYRLGSALYDLKKYDDAIPNLQKNMQMDPWGITQGYYSPTLLGDIYFEQKNYQQAIAAYQKALQINPNNTNAIYKLDRARKAAKG